MTRRDSRRFRHGEGQSRYRAYVENPGGASQRSETHYPRRETTRAFRGARDRDFSLKTKGPTPQEVTGKYVVVWEKVGTDWKVAVDIWNDGK